MKIGSKLSLRVTAIQGRVAVKWRGAVWFSADAPSTAHVRPLEPGLLVLDMNLDPRGGKPPRAHLEWIVTGADGAEATAAMLVLDDEERGATLQLEVIP